MKENLIYYRTSVCNINYHVVWSVKYRRKILDAQVETYLKDVVQQIADEKGFTVQMFECGEQDHVHCFITAPPKLSVTTIVKYLKGIPGRKLYEQFPEIRRVHTRYNKYINNSEKRFLLSSYQKSLFVISRSNFI